MGTHRRRYSYQSVDLRDGRALETDSSRLVWLPTRSACHSLVLCVSVLPERIPGPASVPGEDVEESIQTEQDLAPVVVGCGFVNLQDHPEETDLRR